MRAHGRRPSSEVLRAYQEADFGIFVRPERESSMAGFPTKLAESMMCGTPTVCNDTGDIGLYLNHVNGVPLAGSTGEDVAEGLRAILAMRPEELYAQREAARKTAELVFDFRAHSSSISDFILQVMSQRNPRD